MKRLQHLSRDNKKIHKNPLHNNRSLGATIEPTTYQHEVYQPLSKEKG
jgi:hypothetical protein